MSGAGSRSRISGSDSVAVQACLTRFPAGREACITSPMIACGEDMRMPNSGPSRVWRNWRLDCTTACVLVGEQKQGSLVPNSLFPSRWGPTRCRDCGA
jgi:hypothetical protein